MLLSFIYDLLLLLLGLVALPKLLWHRIKLGKYRKSLGERLGWRLPPAIEKGEGRVVWIHAVSVGETKAVAPLYKKIRSEMPDAKIVISCVTETGLAEAGRSLPAADSYFFLPIDFSWLIKRILHRIQPDLLILVEGEFWYHLLKFTKLSGAQIALVNGKLSERSFKRFKLFGFFSKLLFSYFDKFCLQSSRYYERFLELGISPEKLLITGNLKLDISPVELTDAERATWQDELGIKRDDRVLVIGSSHDPEEEWLLSALDKVWIEIPKLKVLIVPRHPERFSKVAAQLKARGLSIITYTERAFKKGDERVILIDAMGKLLNCFQLAELAIMGGSFVSHVGGHNIFEPVQVGVPVIFGPHMHTQLDLVDLAITSGAGIQVPLASLPETILDLLQNPSRWKQAHHSCLNVTREARGSTERTWQTLKPLL
ncbi:MAG: 3-deoxy-D-manno-octulosonic acid transferase [Chlamydiales bacterium]|nr:3-deoxy-D-manno-octulosonic acid transferase [Chlamydiales bacterium]